MERGHRQDVPPSTHFTAGSDGALAVDGASVEAIAAAHGTPTHVLSAASIREAYRSISLAIGERALVAYAMKANGNPAVLRLLAELGAGADVVSGGELYWALRASEISELIFPILSRSGKIPTVCAFSNMCAT